MPSQQALSACREGILRYFSNFQYPLRSEPMRSIKPFSLSIFNLSDTVFRLRDRFSARKVVVYAGSTARRFRIFSDVSSSVSVTLSVTFSVTLLVTERMSRSSGAVNFIIILYEEIETVDMGPFEAMEAMGATKVRSFISAIVPQVLPSYLSNCLFCFEGNVRYASILGYVGAGGLGLILNEKIGWREYASVGMILLALFVTVFIIETISRAARKRLV